MPQTKEDSGLLRFIKATSPVSIGVLVAIIAGGASVIGFFVSAERMMKNEAVEAVTVHQERNIDRAHPGLVLQVESIVHRELNGKISCLSQDVELLKRDIKHQGDKIEHMQQSQVQIMGIMRRVERTLR